MTLTRVLQYTSDYERNLKVPLHKTIQGVKKGECSVRQRNVMSFSSVNVSVGCALENLAGMARPHLHYRYHPAKNYFSNTTPLFYLPMIYHDEFTAPP